MNNILGKALVGVSLAVTIALAVPLSLMTATIIRGESPRQLAEKAQMVDTVDDAVQDDAQPEDDPAEPVKPMTVGEQFGVKPQVEPDPRLDTSSEHEAVPDPDLEPTAASEPDPEPVPSSPKQPSKSVKKTNNTTKKSAVSTNNTIAAPEPAQQETATIPAEPVRNPNEAPCMVEGLDGPSYIEPVQPIQTAAQQIIPVSQDAPPMLDGLDGYFYDYGNIQTAPSIIPSNEIQTGNTGNTIVPSNGSSAGNTIYITPTGKRYHYDNTCNGGTYIASTLEEALRLGLTPCNKCVN